MANFPIDAGIDDFSHLLSFRRSLSHPTEYHVLVKSQVGANSEARNLALLDQSVKPWLSGAAVARKVPLPSGCPDRLPSAFEIRDR
jgi:hypothetical protein